MSVEIEVVCPACGSRMKVPYFLLGAPTDCPACGRSGVARVPIGTAYPGTMHELTFDEFRQMINRREHRPLASDLLARWFNYRIIGYGDSTQVISSSGESIDAVELHLRIQNDPPKQVELYRAGMSVWR